MHTYLFSQGGLSFYEHGTYGDEEALLVKFNDLYIDSGFWDKPSFEEAEDLLNDLKLRNPVKVSLG
jgi:hypothetical protein|tara:strand:- start:1067 stop:1264 length:198 start_codon:yes stop_codon:yes gene_type:complete